MKPFHEVVDRIRWTPEPMESYVVGYADRFSKTFGEMPLADFLDSDIPWHRARYLRRDGELVWDRRAAIAGRSSARGRGTKRT